MKLTLVLRGFIASLGLLLGAAALGDTSITNLPAATALSGTEAIPIVQAGTTVKTTPGALKTYIGAPTGLTCTPANGLTCSVTNPTGPTIGLNIGVTSSSLAAQTATVALTLANSQLIYGNAFNGSVDLNEIIASTFGGTGSGFVKFSGPTSTEKVFSLPDANATLLYSGGAGDASALTGTASGLTSGTATVAVSAVALQTPRAIAGHNFDGTAAISISASDVGLGSVTNDAQTKAAIVPNTAPSAAQILVGNVGGTAYAPVSLSGPVSITAAGVSSVGTLNQNTTGSAATLTTSRAIYGNNFDGSTALTQVIGSAFGGTGNGFAKFSGPTTSEKTFTLPDANATLLYSGGALGTPSSVTLTNATGLPTTGLTGTLQAAQFPALTGDATTSAGALAVTLANTAVSAGTCTSCNLTIDAKGRVTAQASSSGSGTAYALASGGTLVTSGNFKTHTFNSSSTLTVTQAGWARVLVVGGGGGAKAAGGGGGGGVIETDVYLAVGTYTVTVGAGGTGQITGVATSAAGSPSSFGAITALPGGGAAMTNTAITFAYVGSAAGGNAWSGTTAPAALGFPGQGNNGGVSPGVSPFPGGGGGGATAAGTDGVSTTAGNGGAGWTTSIGGSSDVYGSGGGGGTWGGGTAGTGGTNAGSGVQGANGGNATANRGGGGGGTDSSHTGGNGGSGVVIVKYQSQ